MDVKKLGSVDPDEVTAGIEKINIEIAKMAQELEPDKDINIQRLRVQLRVLSNSIKQIRKLNNLANAGRLMPVQSMWVAMEKALSSRTHKDAQLLAETMYGAGTIESIPLPTDKVTICSHLIKFFESRDLRPPLEQYWNLVINNKGTNS